MVSGPSDSSASHTSSRDPQCTGQPAVQTSDGRVRLETQSTRFSEHHALVGSTGGGLVCVSTVNPATPFLQLEARSRSLGKWDNLPIVEGQSAQICANFNVWLWPSNATRRQEKQAKQDSTTALGPRRRAARLKVCSKRKQLINGTNFYDK